MSQMLSPSPSISLLRLSSRISRSRTLRVRCSACILLRPGSNHVFESTRPISRIASLVLVIPKPGREIPKSVEERSRTDRRLVVNLLAAGSLCVIDWAGTSRAKAAAVRAMKKPVRLLQSHSTGWLLEFFCQLQESSESSPQGPSRTGVGCRCYEGGHSYV